MTNDARELHRFKQILRVRNRQPAGLPARRFGLLQKDPRDSRNGAAIEEGAGGPSLPQLIPRRFHAVPASNHMRTLLGGKGIVHRSVIIMMLIARQIPDVRVVTNLETLPGRGRQRAGLQGEPFARAVHLRSDPALAMAGTSLQSRTAAAGSISPSTSPLIVRHRNFKFRSC